MNERFSMRGVDCSDENMEVLKNILTVRNIVKSVQEYVVKEAYLDVEVVSSFTDNSLPFSLFNLSHGYHGLNNNASLSTVAEELRDQTVSCLRAIAECFNSRKGIYLTQLKKLREISQTSARTIVQNERASAAMSLRRLESSLNEKHDAEVTKLSEALAALKQTISNQDVHIAELQSDLNAFVDKEKHRDELQQAAVESALAAQKAGFEGQFKLQSDGAAVENKRIMDDAVAYINSIKQQHKSEMDAYVDQLKELELRHERDRAGWKEECQQLREQAAKTVKQMNHERDEHKSELKTERDNAQVTLNNVLANGLREQSALKAEMSESLMRVKAEEAKAARELDQRLSALRSALTTEHTMNIEKLHEKHRSEMKRYRAELQVMKDEAVAKLKHTHAQEMSRLVRDNERLQRLVMRNGGGSVLNSLSQNYTSDQFVGSSSSSSGLRRHSTAPLTSSGRGGGSGSYSHHHRDDHSSGSGDSSGVLADNSFAVDEAYESIKQGRSSSAGLGISQNAMRVEEYMKGLERRLVSEEKTATGGDDGHDSDEDSLDNIQLSQLAQLPDVTKEVSFHAFGSELSTEDSR